MEITAINQQPLATDNVIVVNLVLTVCKIAAVEENVFESTEQCLIVLHIG